MKKTLYTEVAYILGIVILAIGTAFMERADFGMSMVVAPAYLFHLKLSEFLPFFSFGMAEYMLQAVLLILLSLILRKAKRTYLFSFVTAVLYGFALDGAIWTVSLIPFSGMLFRVVYYIVGMLMCSLGVAFFFHTYIAPEAYELFVKEIAEKHGQPISRVKTIYDCVSCALSILLSFAFFGLWHFEGVKLGTVICALVNGWIIGKTSKVLQSRFQFRDRLPLRKYFQH
ncbi:MAG: hypothetical protein E7329_03130 [Clostridiales bacterium]|nr:hypothetical protein [Clostridiales bacterium]